MSIIGAEDDNVGPFVSIYILGAFTEKPYSKPLECNVIYTSIITLSHASHMKLSDVK